MKRRIGSIGLVALLAGSAWWLHLRPDSSPKNNAGQTSALPSKTPTATTTLNTPAQSNSPVTSSAPTAPTTSLTPEAARETAYTAIDTAVVRYDATSVTAIAPYLDSADVEIRSLALDGLVRAGDSSGAKVLRTAAAKLKDPREAAAWLDAADFLELPSGGLPHRKPVSSTPASPPATPPSR